MDLSIVIVNYNVRYFLEQVLNSCLKATQGLACEIFVVDNASVDGSVEMVRTKFPTVTLIANKDNVGFSKANNQAIRIATGEFILLLNPDTVVEEDTFTKCVQFMREHEDAGAMGVKMIDGRGRFLPESKRGLPTPLVAFFKVFGLSQIFPKSKLFGRYHLGYLDPAKTHEIEILSGAYMLMRKSALDKVGLLDEDYFMYGEDIDLSYRIILGGYKNYYYPDTQIIHYKGESTKKASANYVFIFYKAMIIFADKHFSGKNAKLFSALINLAIYLRASLSLLKRVISVMAMPLVDLLSILAVFLLSKSYWEQHFRYTKGGQYPKEFLTLYVPMFFACWLLCSFLAGAYEKTIKVTRIGKGVLSGTALILIIYALLPEHLRFSRALILINSLGAILAMLGVRSLFQWLNWQGYTFEDNAKKRIVIAATESESNRISNLINQSNPNVTIIGRIGEGDSDKHYLGEFSKLSEVIKIFKVNEVIFSAKDISSSEIMQAMAQTSSQDVDFKISPPESLYIIGSNSIHKNGELYTIDVNAINSPINRRNKRLFDMLTSLVILILLPVLIWVQENKLGLIANTFKVLFGNRTWVGFSSNLNLIKSIKKGILSPVSALSSKHELDEINKQRLDILYAKDYQVSNDLEILINSWRMLGN